MYNFALNAAVCLALSSPVEAQETPRAGQLAIELIALDQVIQGYTEAGTALAIEAAALKVMVEGNAGRCSGLTQDQAFELAVALVEAELEQGEWVEFIRIRDEVREQISDIGEIRSAAFSCTDNDNTISRANVAAAGMELGRRNNQKAQQLLRFRSTLEAKMIAASIYQTE
jgi:hypothetical protein